MPSVARAIAGALLIGVLNTFGDFVWARLALDHRAVFGVLHGLTLCMGIGLYLGTIRDQPLRGALAGAGIGVAAALGYYLLARAMGYAAMFVMWMAFWVGFGLLNARGLGEPTAPIASGLARGASAALGSGAAFYAVSGIWQRAPGGAGDYAYRLLCWSFAFLPGFLALLAAHRKEMEETR
jgi:hypothetical protein